MQRLQKIVFLALLLPSWQSCARKAVVIVPVADLVGEPIKTFGLAPTNKESYEKIAISFGDLRKTGVDSSYGSPRMHQVLYNEVVDIISEPKADAGDEQEVWIALESAFFITSQLHKPQRLFCMQKKNLISLEKLKQRTVSLEYIPACPSFKKTQEIPQKPTIGLIKPFFDPVTRQTYSVGTRFIFDPLESNPTHYAVKIFNRSITNYQQTYIPKESAYEITQKSKPEAIACFIKLIKEWAHCGAGIIPYVWGGYSYTACFPDAGFKEVPKKLVNGKKIFVYERANLTKRPFTGFDCAGLILRAAQLCGIPYFFKNTYTLAHYLKSLALGEHLHEGDLIWVKGHVMIVSDLANNTIIEARGYDNDFGIVQEIPLNRVFQNINTYKDLIHAFHTRQPLLRLNKAGHHIETITTFKLLKLESAWNHHSY